MVARGQRRKRRIARLLAAVAILVVAAAAGAAIALRRDRTAVFHQVRGRFAEGRTIESWGAPGSPVRRVELVNHRGEAVASAILRRPRALAEDYRILLTYAGAKTGRKILELVPDRRDLVLAAVQYPYRTPSGLRQHLVWPRDLRRAAFRTVAGGMLAVSFLERAEGLDLGRLTVLGSSVGAPFAVIHGALDPRVPRVLVVHGGGDLPLVLRTVARRRGRPWTGELQALAAAVLLDTFDPIHYVGRIAPREVVVIAARDDALFPAASSLALYERAGEPRALLWTESEHLRSERTPALDEVLRQVEAYLEAAPARPLPPPAEPAAGGFEMSADPG